MVKLPRPDAILLDLDNTVYAYAPCHATGLLSAQALAAELRPEWQDFETFKQDYSAARTDVKSRIAATGAAHCRLLYFKVMTEGKWGATRPSEARRLHEAYWAGYTAAMRRDDGCLELLTRWRDAGIRTAWVSDFTTERQMLKLEALGLIEAVEFLITAEEVGGVKPDPSGIDLAVARLGVAENARVWFVGDDIVRDLRAAHSRGLTAILFERGEELHKGEDAYPPHARVRSWATLAELWEGAE
jgi:FMN phosphatase YigB (HAD superfamily)